MVDYAFLLEYSFDKELFIKARYYSIEHAVDLNHPKTDIPSTICG